MLKSTSVVAGLLALALVLASGAPRAAAAPRTTTSSIVSAATPKRALAANPRKGEPETSAKTTGPSTSSPSVAASPATGATASGNVPNVPTKEDSALATVALLMAPRPSEMGPRPITSPTEVELAYAEAITERLVSNLLFDAVGDWLGTPYSHGGSSKRGTCCSGFVTALYRDIYDLDLSGSSRDQWKRITPKKRHELAEGDLVFFKIGSRSISHVGVYLGSNKFAHAALHGGVIISDMADPYYARYYCGGGRIKELTFE